MDECVNGAVMHLLNKPIFNAKSKIHHDAQPRRHSVTAITCCRNLTKPPRLRLEAYAIADKNRRCFANRKKRNKSGDVANVQAQIRAGKQVNICRDRIDHVINYFHIFQPSSVNVSACNCVISTIFHQKQIWGSCKFARI